MGALKEAIRREIAKRVLREAIQYIKEVGVKNLIRSKTFWTGVGAVCFGIVLITQGQTEEGIQTVLGGLTAIFVREAIAKK